MMTMAGANHTQAGCDGPDPAGEAAAGRDPESTGSRGSPTLLASM